MSVFFAIFLFSFLVFIHELGHFAAAKLSGVQVNEFSMFMGPALYKKQVGETLYAIRCIPIGGYCAMEGEDGGSDNPRAFDKAAWWKRLIILFAGAAMNFITGVLIFAILYLPGTRVVAPVVSEFADCCIFNHDSGLQVGDEILSIDGEKIYINGDISLVLDLNQTVNHDVTVLRNGEELTFKNLTMAHMHESDDGTQVLHYGISFGQARETNLFGKLKFVWKVVLDNVRTVRLSLQMLFNGKAGLRDMSGPVGIVQMMSDVANQSDTRKLAFLNMLSFGGMIAVNLAIMNLLPVPALDGGRILGLLVTTAYEKIFGSKPDPKYEGYLHAAGMILLLAFMAFIMIKDIFVIFRG